MLHGLFNIICCLCFGIHGISCLDVQRGPGWISGLVLVSSLFKFLNQRGFSAFRKM